MGIKSKVLAIFAVFGISLSMMGGAAASTPGEVVLTPGDCTLVVESGSFDFGVWKWNGPAGMYELDSSIPGNDALSSIIWNIWYPTPTGGDCFVNANTAGFFLNGDTSLAAISDFSHNPFTWGWNPMNTAVGVNGSGPTGWTEHMFRLNSVPNTYMPGSYSGTIEITVSNSMP